MSDPFDALFDEAKAPCTHLFGQCGECRRCKVCEGHADVCAAKRWGTSACCAEKAKHGVDGMRIEECRGKFWLMRRGAPLNWAVEVCRCPWCGKPVERAT